MWRLRTLLRVIILVTATFAPNVRAVAESPPRLSEEVFKKWTAMQNGYSRHYPIEQLPLLFKAINQSKSAADMFEKLSKEDAFPMRFMGEDSKLGKIDLYIFNVWVSDEARMLGQNRVYVEMYYTYPFYLEKRGHIQQPVEVHW